MADKQLDNNNLESAIPENPEISDEQLEGATGGWNTKRKVYYVFCRECRSAYACYNDEQVKQIVTNPCRNCGAPNTCLYIDPNLCPPPVEH